MPLSTDMERLAAEMRAAIEYRHAAVEAVRDAVRSTLAASASQRAAVLHDYRVESRKYLTALAKDVSGKRRAAAAQVKRLRIARRRLGSQVRSGLRRDVGVIAKQARDIRVETAELMRSLSAAHGEMAEYQKAVLGEVRGKLRTEVAGVLDGLRGDRSTASGFWAQVRASEPEVEPVTRSRRPATSEGSATPSSRKAKSSGDAAGATPARSSKSRKQAETPAPAPSGETGDDAPSRGD